MCDSPKHTRLPYIVRHVTTQDGTGGKKRLAIVDPDGNILAKFDGWSKQARINADFIALACNCHYSLLAAGEAQVAWFEAEKDHLGSFHDRMNLCDYCEFTMNKALAKIAGEPFDKKWEGVPKILVDIRTFKTELVRKQGKPTAIAKAKP